MNCFSNWLYRFTYFFNPSFNCNKGSARDKKIRFVSSCQNFHLKQRLLSRAPKIKNKKRKKKKKKYNSYNLFHSVLVINIILLLHTILSMIHVPALFWLCEPNNVEKAMFKFYAIEISFWKIIFQWFPRRDSWILFFSVSLCSF